MGDYFEKACEGPPMSCGNNGAVSEELQKQKAAKKGSVNRPGGGETFEALEPLPIGREPGLICSKPTLGFKLCSFMLFRSYLLLMCFTQQV